MAADSVAGVVSAEGAVVSVEEAALLGERVKWVELRSGEVEPATQPDLMLVRHQIGVLSKVASAFLIPDNHIGRATVSSIAPSIPCSRGPTCGTATSWECRRRSSGTRRRSAS